MLEVRLTLAKDIPENFGRGIILGVEGSLYDAEKEFRTISLQHERAVRIISGKRIEPNRYTRSMRELDYFFRQPLYEGRSELGEERLYVQVTNAVIDGEQMARSFRLNRDPLSVALLFSTTALQDENLATELGLVLGYNVAGHEFINIYCPRDDCSLRAGLITEPRILKSLAKRIELEELPFCERHSGF